MNRSTQEPSVIHVLWSGRVGGIERMVTDLAREQVRHGLQVGVAFARAEGPFFAEAHASGAAVVDLRLATGYDVRPRTISRAARALEAFDLVHLHGYNPAFEAVCRRADSPIVFTEHGSFGQGRTVGLGHMLKQRLKARFLKKIVAVIAANSSFTASRLAGVHAIPESSVQVVYNGIRTPEFRKPAHIPAPTDGLRVAYVGRLAQFKRVDRLLDAVARLPDMLGLRVTIVGSGPLEAELRKQAAGTGIDSCVAFVGYCEDVASILASEDVLVQPSTEEPFGLAIVEGVAAGALPIVFADGGGALEAIPPDGLVVQDVNELAAVLAQLPGSEALSVGARGARSSWVTQRFHISRTHQAYLELYRVAVTRRHT